MTVDTLLVVDDDPNVRRLLRNCLEADGYSVLEAGDQSSTLNHLAKDSVSLVTLDLNLGRDNGFDLARLIRRDYDVPIIMVTGRDDVIDRVVGLELGADDYIVKPFHNREMLARVRSVLRRTKAGKAASVPGTKPDESAHEAGERFAFDGMVADTGRMEVVDRDGRAIDLTASDFRLLEVFLNAAQRVLSRDAIMDRLHGQAWSPYDRTVDNQVARLRKKIEADPANPRLIKTVRGVGYTFAAEVSRN